MSWYEDNCGDIEIQDEINRQKADQSHHQNRRDLEWITADGGTIRVKDMTDEHLYNAWNMSGSNGLLIEMMDRLFLERINK